MSTRATLYFCLGLEVGGGKSRGVRAEIRDTVAGQEGNHVYLKETRTKRETMFA